jgi:2-aminoadipate transaminase
MKIKYAKRANNIKPSAIREIFKVAKLPGVISLAGGLPAPESFPHTIVKSIIKTMFQKNKDDILQYGLSEGLPQLRQEIIKLQYKLDKKKYQQENILITTGAQEVMDLVAKVLVDPDDIILVESPTFTGALSSFAPYRPKYKAIKTDDNGVVPDHIESLLKKYKNIKLIYLIPNFQNPTGTTISLERRKQIARLAEKYKVFVLEDDPYRLIRFEGKNLPSIASYDNKGWILYASSFSKILAPGLRLGWICGPKQFIEKLVFAKQGVNLHTSPFVQFIAYYYLHQGHLNSHLPKIQKIYQSKAKIMKQSLKKELGAIAQFTNPQGGMFYWLKTNKALDLTKLYHKAAYDFKVAYVPGEHFYAPGTKVYKNTMRLNFSYPTALQITKGIKRLRKLFSII